MPGEFEDYLRASNELNGLVRDGKLPVALQGDGYSVSEVTCKMVAPLLSLVTSSEQPITPADIPTWNQVLWPRLQNGLTAAGLRPAYPCVYFYSQCDASRFILQIGFPVPDWPNPIPGDLIERRDPGHWCASAVLIGPFIPHIRHAWAAATDYVAKNDLHRSGEDREIYHHMTDFICTEVQIGLVAPPEP